MTVTGPPAIRGAPFPCQAFKEEVVSHRFLGREMMIVSRPDSVQHILSTGADRYRRPQAAARILSPPIGGGLFLAEGEEWRRQRRLLAPSFSPRENRRHLRTAVTLTERAAAELAGAAPGAIALFSEVQRLTLEIAAWSLLSIDMRPYDGPVRDLMRAYASRLARPDILDFLLPAGIPSPMDFRRWRFRRRWIAMIQQIVADRRRFTAEPPDLFDRIAPSEEARGLLVQQVATLLVTGSETTGAAVYWTIELLTARPDLQAAIAEEAAAFAFERDDLAEGLNQLAQTRAAVNEAMRLYPPAFSVVREAKENDDAAGLRIPKGAIVQVAPFVLHRHESFWQLPNRFEPARFLPGTAPPTRWTYLPFGAGPRACIAAQLAPLETVAIVAILVRDYEIARTTDDPVTPVAQITLQPYRPPPFRLRRRAGRSGSVNRRHFPSVP